MSYYVKRTSKSNPAGYAYTGPIASEAQAHKEAEAWESAGETAEVLVSSSAVKAAVKLWDKITHSDDARELVTFQGEQMTFARYRLEYEAA